MLTELNKLEMIKAVIENELGQRDIDVTVWNATITEIAVHIHVTAEDAEGNSYQKTCLGRLENGMDDLDTILPSLGETIINGVLLDLEEGIE